jgi:hypothetical protein
MFRFYINQKIRICQIYFTNNLQKQCPSFSISSLCHTQGQIF